MCDHVISSLKISQFSPMALSESLNSLMWLTRSSSTTCSLSAFPASSQASLPLLPSLFSHLLNKHFLSTCNVLHTVLTIGDTKMNRPDMAHATLALQVPQCTAFWITTHPKCCFLRSESATHLASIYLASNLQILDLTWIPQDNKFSLSLKTWS